MAEEHGQEETSTHGVLLQAQGRREVRNSSERPSTNTGTSEGRSVACDLRINIEILPSAEGKTATLSAVGLLFEDALRGSSLGITMTRCRVRSTVILAVLAVDVGSLAATKLLKQERNLEMNVLQRIAFISS